MMAMRLPVDAARVNGVAPVAICASTALRCSRPMRTGLPSAASRTQASSHSVSVDVAKTGVITSSLTLSDLGSITLWSVDNPRLYTVQATLNVPGMGASALSNQIGFREASFRPDGFYLNGKRLQLFGLDRRRAAVHQRLRRRAPGLRRPRP